MVRGCAPYGWKITLNSKVQTMRGKFVKVRIIQIPYTGYISASWYNREESYLEQLEVFSNCSFLIAQNMLLHLRIIS